MTDSKYKSDRRTWIKLFVEPTLRGSIRKGRLIVRGTFYELILLAGDSAFGEDGIIQIAESVGFNDKMIAGILNTDLEDWLFAKERLANHPDPSENRIEIFPLSSGFAIRVMNWKLYQSDYSRLKSAQHRYWQKKKALRSQSSPLDHHSSKILQKSDEDEDEDGEGRGRGTISPPHSIKASIKRSIKSSIKSKNDDLPPIPKNASFETIKELEVIQRQIYDLKSRKDFNENMENYSTLKSRYLKLVGMYDR